jgi:hypothetical protein
MANCDVVHVSVADRVLALKGAYADGNGLVASDVAEQSIGAESGITRTCGVTL